MVVGVSTAPPDMEFGISNGTITISWPADHTGWQLQSQTNLLETNWMTWPGSIATNDLIIPFNPTNDAFFYRLIYPPQ